MIFSSADVVVVRALVVAPAHVHPHAVGGDVAQRLVEHLDVQRRALDEFLVGSVAVHVWRPIARSGASICSRSRRHDRLVLGPHRLGDRVEVLVRVA